MYLVTMQTISAERGREMRQQAARLEARAGGPQCFRGHGPPGSGSHSSRGTHGPWPGTSGCRARRPPDNRRGANGEHPAKTLRVSFCAFAVRSGKRPIQAPRAAAEKHTRQQISQGVRAAREQAIIRTSIGK